MVSIDIPLKGKIILITGGASGIGLSLTRQCHALGAQVIVGDLRPTADLEKFIQGKEKEVIFQECDVSQWKNFDRLFATCENAWGDVPDAYGICAGLFEPPFSNFWQDPEEHSYKQVDVNVSHPIKLTRMAIRKSLGRGKRASICIIASMAGISGNIAAPLYCATKHAIIGFVKSVKDTESLTGVKITTILPGLVNTPLFTADKMQQFSFAEKNALSPDQVAASMLDLIQKKEHPCGTVLEISTAGTRVIPEWNIQPPAGAGTGQDIIDVEAPIRAMLAPIEKKLAFERGMAKL